MSRWLTLTLAAIILAAVAGALYAFFARAPEPPSPAYRTPQPEVDATCEVWRALSADQRGKMPEKCTTLSTPEAAR